LPERIDAINGGWLPHEDLEDRFALVAHHLERHVRAAHDTWGVALGFEIDDAASRIRVGPGLAIDACGRPLLTARSVELERPPPGTAAIVVAGSTAPSRAQGSPRATLRVTRPGWPIRYGEEVVLATIAANGTVDANTRQLVRKLSPARVAAGRTPIGGAAVDGNVLCWEAWIDTSAARLDAVPLYFVSLPSAGDGTAGPYAAIDDAMESGFRLTVRYGVADAGEADERAQPLDALPLPVVWTAVVPAVTASVPEPPVRGGVPCLP
jgi:hypothetical protein